MFLIKISFVLLLSAFVSCQNDTNETTTTSTTSTTTTTISSTTTSTTTSTTKATKLASTCTLNESSPKEKSFLDKVLAHDKKQFQWEDRDHMYYFGVCTKANNAKEVNQAFVQINKKSRNQVVIGRLDDVDLEGFGIESEGIRIQYNNGDKYPHVCNQAQRKAVVYIICNTKNSSDVFEMIEENHDRKGDSCGYIFQLRTPLMCTNTPTPEPGTTTPCPTNNPTTTTSSSNPSGKASRLGFVSIMTFILIGVLFIYFVFGSIYNRYVKQARGVEQLPHHEVWQTIGIKSADCCNYICRCGKTQSEIRNYEHISDHLSDDDENLLNM